MRRCEATTKSCKLYTSEYLKQAQDSRDISEYAYKRGAASLLDFLDAERSYRAAQLAYRQALASYMTALEQLKQAVGVEEPAMKMWNDKNRGGQAVRQSPGLCIALALIAVSDHAGVGRMRRIDCERGRHESQPERS